MSRSASLAALVLTAWAGSLWTICGVVIPGLFWLIDDKKLAGNVATQFFVAVSLLSTLFGLMYGLLRRTYLHHSTVRWWLAGVAAPLLFVLVLRPFMNAARSAGDMARFGQLHGLSTTLFLIACVAVAVLVWRSQIPRHPAK